MKTFSYRVIIEPDDPKGFHGFVPLLPGIHTCGDTIEETKINLREAILCHLQGFLKDYNDLQMIPQENNAMELIQTFSEKDFQCQYA